MTNIFKLLEFYRYFEILVEKVQPQILVQHTLQLELSFHPSTNILIILLNFEISPNLLGVHPILSCTMR